MVNDDVNNKAINLEIKVAQYSAKGYFESYERLQKIPLKKPATQLSWLTNSKLKDMVKGQLENIDLQKGEVRIKSSLTDTELIFVMKNKESGLYSVFFRQGYQGLQIQLKKAMKDLKRKQKGVYKEILNKFKKGEKYGRVKDKVKEKVMNMRDKGPGILEILDVFY